MRHFRDDSHPAVPSLIYKRGECLKYIKKTASTFLTPGRVYKQVSNSNWPFVVNDSGKESYYSDTSFEKCHESGVTFVEGVVDFQRELAAL